MPIGVYDRPIYNVVCSICGSSYTQRRKPIGNPKCKLCQKKCNDRKYYESNKDRILEHQSTDAYKQLKKVHNKTYYTAHKEECLEKCHDYYVRNRDMILSHQESKRRAFGEKKTGRSEIEVKVLSYVKEVFSNHVILLNDRSTILNPMTGHYLELDIYIPAEKVAIEIQGPTHYSKIYGDEKYNRQIRNDQVKREVCKSLGIRLIEIKLEEGVHYDRYSTENERLRKTVISYLKDFLVEIP